jgi:hypothetical protein
MQMLNAADLPDDVLEQLAAAQRLQEQAIEREFEHRTRLFRFGALFCACRPWPDGSPMPPQQKCILHSQFLIGLDGRVL